MQEKEDLQRTATALEKLIDNQKQVWCVCVFIHYKHHILYTYVNVTYVCMVGLFVLGVCIKCWAI